MSSDFDTSQISRPELLKLLTSFGVALPPKTKLPTENLLKRLRSAINASQDIKTLVPSPPIDPSSLPLWDKGKHKSSIYDASVRGNHREAMANFRARMSGKKDAHPELYTDPFTYLRHSVMSICKNVDDGQKIFIMQDPDQENCAVNIRVISVHYLAEKTPLVLLLYYPATKQNLSAAFPWVRRHAVSRNPLATIIATPLEQKLFLKMLSSNSKFLSTIFSVSRERDELDYTLSFLLPVGPLPSEELGRLNADTGCAVCGQKTTSRCSQCQSILYCSPVCQREDWKSHKATCRSLKGGKWRTLPLALAPDERYDGMYGAVWDGSKPRANKVKKIDLSNPTPPPNIHGDKLFMVKIQAQIWGGNNMLVYDRQRSFQMNFMKKSNEALYDEVDEEIERNGVGKLKMYRWARRGGDFKIDVCIDRAPLDDITW